MSVTKSHWLSGAAEILTSDKSDLRVLMESMGGDPRTFYVGTDLSGADLRGMDLRGINFACATVNHTTLISSRTQYDPEFARLFSQAHFTGGLARINALHISRRISGLLASLRK